MPKTVVQWQTYLESLDPSKIELGLACVQRVFNTLNLSISSKVIVVAGTNGKGSTVSALQALLLSQGKTVGSYMSPHLQKFNERICYQGHAVSDNELVDAFQYVDAARGDIALTYFEFTTLAAINLLSQKSPDYLIFEVGLGGRLDAVNILDADIAIVTGVALDHTDWLGDDLESIGYEKAGVYRTDKPAIYASTHCPDSVTARIRELNAKPYILGDQLSIDEQPECTTYKVQTGGETYSISLEHQHLPSTSLLAVVSAFVLLGFELSGDIAGVLTDVSVMGRYQHLEFINTKCILDVAHNAQAAEYLATRLLTDTRMVKPAALVGTMSDKPLKEIFAPMVAVVSQWFLLQPDISRASSLEQQRKVLVELGVDTVNIQDVGPISLDNIEGCLQQIEAAVVFGSFYTVGEFLGLVDFKNV